MWLPIDVLRSVGQIIHSTVREGDIGFRYGGDEFAVVLPGCEAAAAKRVIERLQSLVQSLGVALKAPAVRPRLSIGLSTLDELTEPTGRESAQTGRGKTVGIQGGKAAGGGMPRLNRGVMSLKTSGIAVPRLCPPKGNATPCQTGRYL